MSNYYGYWDPYDPNRPGGGGGGGGGAGIMMIFALIAMAVFLLIGGGLFLIFAFPAASLAAVAAAYVVMRICEIFFADGTTPVMLTLIGIIIVAFIYTFRKAMWLEHWIARHRWAMLARHVWRLFGAGYGAYGVLAPWLGEPGDRGDFFRIAGSFPAMAQYAWLMLPYYAGKLMQPWLVFSNLAFLGSVVAMVAAHFWLKHRYEDNYGRWPFTIRLPFGRAARG